LLVALYDACCGKVDFGLEEEMMNGRVVRLLDTLVFSVALGLLLAVPAKAADAAATFKAKCAACHGADGSGNTAVGKSMHLRDLGSADVQKQTDSDLSTMISSGKGGMPAFKGKITDDQIKQMVTFIRGLAKKG
jgi:cytochrome c6